MSRSQTSTARRARTTTGRRRSAASSRPKAKGRRSAPARPRSKPARTRRPARPASTEAPGWEDLSRSARPRKGVGSAGPGRRTTLRYVLWTLAAAAALTLYVGHVHATRALLADVQTAQRDNLRLHLKVNRLKGEYDRQTGPAVIRRRARALGLVEDYHFGPTIYLTLDP